MNTYITDMAVYLPNEPVDNEKVEQVLGKIGGVASRTRRVILRNNGIQSRYYALNPETGKLTHTNAQLTAEAVRRLRPYQGWRLSDLACLACGTTSPDLLNPGHALMVQGELKVGPMETCSTQGICLSGMTALRYAASAIAQGLHTNAVATGSELSSSNMRAGFYSQPHSAKVDLEKKPQLAFDAEFLRWMLSDGAGAAFMQPQPRAGGISLKIEWLEMLSFAHELPVCMYLGGVKKPDGNMVGWRALPGGVDEAVKTNALAIHQDVELLNREVIKATVERALSLVAARRNLKAKDVDWFLPHFSSYYFKDKVFQAMSKIGFEVPENKWFTNLKTKGNTGSASIYILLEELFHSGRLKPGDRLLCYVPESARFSVGYLLLTVVEA